MANKLFEIFNVLLCIILSVSALPFNQIDGVKEQSGLYRRSPGNGIYTSNVIRNRVDIAMRAKSRLASAPSDLRNGNIGSAIGHFVSGTIASHPRMQSVIAHGRATRQAYQSQMKRK